MQTLKSIEALQLKTTDIVNIIPKRIAEYVETAAREARYGRQLLRINRQLLETKGRSVHLPTRGSITADRLSEAAQPTEQKVTWSTTEVTPFRLGTQVYITQQSIDATEIDVINGSLEEAGLAIADREDMEIFNELLGRQPDPTEDANGRWSWDSQSDSFTGDGTTTVFTLTKKPVIEVEEVTVGGTATSAYKMDYYDGKIEFTTAPASGASIVVKYWYSKRGLVVDAKTKGQLSYEDMVSAKTLIRSKKIEADVAVMNPDEYADILTDSRFIDASQYGAREPILRGEIGQAGGLKILVSTVVPSGTVLYLSTRRAGWLVLKREVDVKRKESQETDAYKFFFYLEMAPKVTDDNAVAISVNHAPDAKDI